MTDRIPRTNFLQRPRRLRLGFSIGSLISEMAHATVQAFEVASFRPPSAMKRSNAPTPGRDGRYSNQQ